MKEIPLTQGQVALVDDEDYEDLAKHKWHASNTNGNFYAMRNVRGGGKLYMHRVILHAEKGWEVDHTNHNCLDNRRSNVRIASSSQNHANMRKARGSSKYKGVNWHKVSKKWQAQIRGPFLFLGLFTDESEAAQAYDSAAREQFGAFAALNFPRQGEVSAITPERVTG